jgi:hypothetical protein
MRILRNESSTTWLAQKGEKDAYEDYVARVALSDNEHQSSGSMGGLDGPPSGQYV